MTDFFPYDLDQRWSPMFTLMGVGRRDGVTITQPGERDSSGTVRADGRLRATFGRLRVRTPLSNIDHTEITGPHRWYTAVGPRLSFADDGLTFGTNHRLGLCIGFREPIDKVIGMKKHSALWVSVADPEALAEALEPFCA